VLPYQRSMHESTPPLHWVPRNFFHPPFDKNCHLGSPANKIINVLNQRMKSIEDLELPICYVVEKLMMGMKAPSLARVNINSNCHDDMIRLSK